MKKLIKLSLACIVLAGTCPVVQAKGDDFGAVVKVIEQFYHVKHKGIPFLAKAGMKTAVTVARLAGGSRKRLAEAGSVKVAYFEDQEFNNSGSVLGFRSVINKALAGGWSLLIQVLAPQDQEQSYIYLSEAGEKFNVLVVNIGRREGSVVQVTLSPKTLAALMRNPEEMGEAITTEATTEDQE